MKAITTLLILIIAFASTAAQYDTIQVIEGNTVVTSVSLSEPIKMLFGDWYIDGGNILNIEINEQATFSRANNDSLFLKWTFHEYGKFESSGVKTSPNNKYAIGFSSKPKKWTFNKDQYEISIIDGYHQMEYKIDKLYGELLTITRFK